MEEVIVRYFHFMGIFLVVAALFAEHMLIKAEMTPQELRKVAIIDAVYSISAIVVLGAGLLLWFWVGKPAGFYTANPLFHVKVTLFVLLGGLSLYPTVFFIRQRNAVANKIIPKAIIHLVRVELLLLFVIPLLAVMMARGYGIPG